jgi:hypothetical protein
MDISVNLVIQSHLSDSLVEISNNQENLAFNRIRFVKRLHQLQSSKKIAERISEDELNILWKETVNS